MIIALAFWTGAPGHIAPDTVKLRTVLAVRLFRLTTSGVNVQAASSGRTEYEPGLTVNEELPVALVSAPAWLWPLRRIGMFGTPTLPVFVTRPEMVIWVIADCISVTSPPAV